MITSGSQFPYQAFLSYRNATDYSHARWIESFLEGFHKNLGNQTKPMEQVQVCRDGSDFRLPTARDSSKGQDVVWEIIRGELAKSEFLLVLCSPGICESKWADREIGWFLANHPDRILLAVTQAENPELHPEECFPNSILTREMHKSQIWYDLRGHERVQRKRGIRNWEDEMVRLAADLLRWDAQKHGSLATTYQREQLRRRKRQATAISLAATAMLALASLGAWFAWQSNVQAKQARSSAIVASAQALPDPLTSALLLTELDDDEPQRGVEVARAIAAERLASAELRGPPSAIGEIQFVPGTNAVAAVASDGSLWFWPHDGRGDPLTPGFSVKQNPVNLAIRADGHVFATAIREQQALVWSPGGASLQKYQTPGPIQG